MAQFAYPKALTGLRDTEWSHYLGTFLSDGITQSNSFKPTANGGGLWVDLAAGEVIVQGVLHGNDSTERVPIAAPNSAPRTDVIVKRLNRENPGQIITTAVVKGTPGGGAPVLTQDPTGVWEWPVAEVLVPVGAVVIAQTYVTDRRSIGPRAVARWSTENRPKPDPARPTPLLGWNSTLREWEYITTDGFETVVPDTLPLSRGGTGAKTAAAARANLGAAPVSHNHAASDITSGSLPISRGGTGATSAAAARSALGAAPTSHTHTWSQVTGKPSTFAPSSHTHKAKQITTEAGTVLQTWMEDMGPKLAAKADVSHTHTWGQVTGKPSTFAPSSHTHPWSQVTGKPLTFAPSPHTHSAAQITSGTLPISRGGTGGTSAASARSALGAAPTSHTHTGSQVTVSGMPRSNVQDMLALNSRDLDSLIAQVQTLTARDIGVFGTNVENYLSGLNSRIAKIESALK